MSYSSWSAHLIFCEWSIWVLNTFYRVSRLTPILCCCKCFSLFFNFWCFWFRYVFSRSMKTKCLWNVAKLLHASLIQHDGKPNPNNKTFLWQRVHILTVGEKKYVFLTKPKSQRVALISVSLSMRVSFWFPCWSFFIIFNFNSTINLFLNWLLYI